MCYRTVELPATPFVFTEPGFETYEIGPLRIEESVAFCERILRGWTNEGGVLCGSCNSWLTANPQM